MRREERIQEILGLLEIAWEDNPDWRLGQLISNIQGVGMQDVFYTEDEGSELAWKEMIKKFIVVGTVSN